MRPVSPPPAPPPVSAAAVSAPAESAETTGVSNGGDENTDPIAREDLERTPGDVVRH